MRLFASALLGGLAALLLLILVAAYGLDRMSAGYNLFAVWNAAAPDGKTNHARYVQFTNDPGVLHFGFQVSEGLPDTPPFALSVEPLMEGEREARAEYEKTAEASTKPKFLLGISRQVTQSPGQTSRGDDVYIKIAVIYVLAAFALIANVTLFILLYRRPNPPVASKRTKPPR